MWFTKSLRLRRVERRRERLQAGASRLGRRGMATFEMTISLPLLAFVAAAIIVAADGGVLSIHTGIDARTKAFTESLDTPISGSMDRFLLESVATSDRYTRDIATGEASRTMTVIPVLKKSQITARRQVAVMRNTWSYRQLPLDDGTRIELYGQLALAGGAGDATALLAQIQAVDVSGLLSQLGTLSNQTQQDPPGNDQWQGKAEEANKRIEAERKAAEDTIARLEGEIRQLDRDIMKLEDDKRKAEETYRDNPTELAKAKEMIDEMIEAKEDLKTTKRQQIANEQRKLNVLKKADRT